MTKNIKVSASVLCADFLKLGEQIKKCEDAGVDMIHVDVMDGHFVPPITVGSMIVEAIRPITKLAIDAHLMVNQPWTQIDSFINAGVDIISIHVECYGKLKPECDGFGKYPKEITSLDISKIKADIEKIKKGGKQVFVVINPGTPLCIDPILKDIDGVLIMSVNPGFARQKFIPSVLPKLEKLSKNFEGDIAIDGGINNLTAPEAVKAGANILATASYFFGADDPKKLVKGLKALS